MSIKLKLVKGLSYRGGKDGTLRATKDKPFCSVETLEEAQAAVASGHFQIVEIPKAEKAKVSENEGSEKSISRMTKDELEAYAAEIGVDISDCKNNDERKEAIKKALDGDSEDETEGADDESKVPFQEEE